MRPTTRRPAALVAAIALAATGCVGGGPDDTEPQRSAAAPGDDAEPDGDGPDGIGEGAAGEARLIDHRDVLGTAAATSEDRDGLSLAVVQVERLDDNAIAVSFQLVNDGDDEQSVSRLFGALRARNMTIEAEGRRAGPLDEEGDSTWSMTSSGAQLSGSLDPGDKKGYQAVFADLGTDTIAFTAGGFEPVEDLPVADATPAGITDGLVATIHELSIDGVRIDIRPLERSDDLVALRMTLHNDADGRYTGVAARAALEHSWRDGGRALGTLGNVSLIDPATGRRHLPVRDDDGLCWCDSSYQTRAGDSSELTVVYGAPEGDVASLYLPEFGTVPLLPVVDVDGWTNLTINDDPVEEQIVVDRDDRPRLVSTLEELDGDTVTRATRSGADSTDVALASDVLFDVDADQLRSDADPLLDDLVAQLEQVQVSAPIRIEGHTDSTGSRSHNQDLSERRAASVLAAIEQRLSRTDLTFEVEGFGQSQPAVEEESDADRQRNRRVEIRIPTG